MNQLESCLLRIETRFGRFSAALVVGMFADERILVAVPLILLWHFLLNPQTPRREMCIRAAWFTGTAPAATLPS